MGHIKHSLHADYTLPEVITKWRHVVAVSQGWFSMLPQHQSRLVST